MAFYLVKITVFCRYSRDINYCKKQNKKIIYTPGKPQETVIYRHKIRKFLLLKVARLCAVYVKKAWHIK